MASNQVFRHALPGERGRSGFDATSRSVSRPHQWFTCIRLSNPHMTQFTHAFSVTFTTIAIGRQQLTAV